jgi:enoyl-[acyl-carrier protein] reductase III
MSDLFSVSGQRVLVAGGTRGLGRAISLRLARAGAEVLANYVRNDERASHLADLARAEALQLTTCRADLTNGKGIQHLMDTLENQGWTGRLSSLVYCAATGVHKAFSDMSVRHFDWTFALNVRAFFDLSTRLQKHFDSKASIIAISSLGAHRTLPAYSLVGSSKGALEALSRHMASELGVRGIRVNILCSGTVETEAWDILPDASHRLGKAREKSAFARLVLPEEVATCVQFLCSDASSGITGSTLVVDAGEGLPA